MRDRWRVRKSGCSRGIVIVWQRESESLAAAGGRESMIRRLVISVAHTGTGEPPGPGVLEKGQERWHCHRGSYAMVHTGPWCVASHRLCAQQLGGLIIVSTSHSYWCVLDLGTSMSVSDTVSLSDSA